MENHKITLRGVSLSKEALEEKYGFELSEEEWKIFSSKISHSWTHDEEAIRKLVFNHIKNALEDSGFKLQIGEKGLEFKRV